MGEPADLGGAAFGAIIVFLRNLRGWNQDELREACGWRENDSRLSKHEAGTQLPRTENARKITGALGVPLKVLYELQERFLDYVRENPVDFDALLRTSGAVSAGDEIREPPAVFGAPTPGDEILERWRALAREEGATKEREVLLLIDTVFELLGRPTKRPS